MEQIMTGVSVQKSPFHSRPGTGNGLWTRMAVLARERWPWCMRRSMHDCLRMSLRVLDES